MRICVLGAGVVGTTTAYYLARAGHDVVLVDRNGAPGQETSFANGGQLSYSYVAPLAAPGIGSHILDWIFGRDSALKLTLRPDPWQWRWLANFMLASRSPVYERSIVELSALAYLSRSLVHDLVAREGLDFAFARSGKLVVHRDAAALESAGRLVEMQARLGAEQRVLDRDACVALEPSLAHIAPQLAGGVYTPSEEAGDCARFCAELDRVLAGMTAVERLYHHRTGSFAMEGGRVKAIVTNRGPVEAELFVVAAGLESRALLKPLGVHLPLYPLKGYSLTVPVAADDAAPRVSVTDARRKIVYARLGAFERIAAMVDLGARDATVVPARLADLKDKVRQSFPRLGTLDDAAVWSGLRPATAQGKPVIGPTPVANLFVNVGHGALGFTLSCGSARLVTDLIGGREPAISAAPFALGTVY
ncbi:D-amino acid dehydrogenase [Pseudoxanthobacter sp.]|uniref:D-amino acid dehydrogenase n=1 Tax=Pseudoxanthobacter sp. TaxID=1925742 RepID=UPI002FE242AE